MRVDAHQHYWQIDRGDYGWLTPAMGILCKDYLPADLEPLLKQTRMDKTVVVQAAPTIAETEFLLSLCEQDSSIAGVVGWLDLESDQFEKDFQRLRNNRFFVSIRPMLQDISDDAYILRPKVVESLRLLVEHQFPIDLLVLPRHLPYIIKLLEIVPGLKAVVDHIAKPHIAVGTFSPWDSHIREIASHSNIHCKLSGMVTEAEHHSWKPEHFIPYAHHIIEVFGTDRTMFGSDWPVCLLSATYTEVLDLVNGILPPNVTDKDKVKLFGLNAIKFYNLKV